MGLFPHKFSMNDKSKFEEERRLCYVGITRAKKQVYMTYAKSRNVFGYTNWNEPSLFIDEIPSELIKTSEELDRYELLEESLDFDYRSGEIVYHSKFGRGKIVDVAGSGEDTQVRVRFSSGRMKTMMAKYANLQR